MYSDHRKISVDDVVEIFFYIGIYFSAGVPWAQKGDFTKCMSVCSPGEKITWSISTKCATNI